MKQRRAERLGDEDLMALVAAKDAEAFEVFYDRQGGTAYSLAYRIVGDRTSAEDVVQEAFLSIWRSATRYDRTKGSVRTWTLAIVRKRAIDALRRESVRAPGTAYDVHAVLDQRPAPERTDEQAIQHEDARRVRGALNELPREQSTVIKLAYFGGFSHSEIATMLGLPMGTVKGRMRLGIDKIRTRLVEGVS